jgi:hypothetical protein
VSSIIKLDAGKTTASRIPLRVFAHRRSPRCPLAVPVRVTVLRAGTAYSIPGRSVDLGEGGIAVVLAGEVRAADSVGVEFLLPDLGLGLQAKAVVRHHAPLRCGFEFRSLTRHQQAVIREWVRQRMQANSDQKSSAPGHERDDEMDVSFSQDRSARRSIARRLRLAGTVCLTAAMVVALGKRMEGTGKTSSPVRQSGQLRFSSADSGFSGCSPGNGPSRAANPVGAHTSVRAPFQSGENFTSRPSGPCGRRAELWRC